MIDNTAVRECSSHFPVTNGVKEIYSKKQNPWNHSSPTTQICLGPAPRHTTETNRQGFAECIKHGGGFYTTPSPCGDKLLANCLVRGEGGISLRNYCGRTASVLCQWVKVSEKVVRGLELWRELIGLQGNKEREKTR